MNPSYISLTLTRRYVTELVRSPRAMAALAPRAARPSSAAPRSTVSPAAPGTAGPSITGTTAPMMAQASQSAM